MTKKVLKPEKKKGPITKEEQLPLSKAVVSLLGSKPFYGWILANTSRRFTRQLDAYAAVGVTDRIVLYINPDLFNALPSIQQKGMLEHELNHILLNHIMRHPRTKGSDPKRWNVAEDIVINDLVDPKFAEGLLPPSGCCSDKFGFPEGKSSEWYYNALEKKMKKIILKLPGGKQQGGGGDPTVGDENTIVIEILDSHDKWGGNDTNNEATISEVMLRVTIEQLIDRAERETQSYGSLPGWLQQMIDQIRTPRQVPWQRVMRKFIAKGGKGKITYTKKRESKRYGTRPGVKLGNQLKVWVAIDDSGSISDFQLSVFAAELKHLANTGAEVMIMCADTEVTSVAPFKRQLNSVTGRGGTDLGAPFRYLQKHKIRPDAFVYMTDGYGPTLDSEPFPTLWVFTQDGTAPAEWGQQIFIKDKELEGVS